MTIHKRPHSSPEDRVPLVGIGDGGSSSSSSSRVPPRQQRDPPVAGTSRSNGNGLSGGQAAHAPASSSATTASRYVITTKSRCLRRMLNSSSVPSEAGSGDMRVDLDSFCARIVRLGVLFVGIAFSVVHFGPGFGIGGDYYHSGSSSSSLRLKSRSGGVSGGRSSISGGGDGAGSSSTASTPLPNPPPRSLIQARSKRWEDNEEETCRFPTFVNEDETFYDMKKGAYTLEYGDDLRKGHFRYRLKFARGRHSTSLAQYQKKNNATGKKSISFLHIGKAGGSSLVCHMRGALAFGYHCPQYSSNAQTILGFPLDGDKESQISKMVNCYVHYDFRMHCYDNPTLAINVRNPIDRLASWYHYEHLENMQVLWTDRIRSCGQQMLYKCYNSFHDLAQYGLAGIRPPPTDLLRVQYNASEEICRHWAWATVQGTAPASFHNVWNYDWFGSPAIAFDKEIIAFRTNHVEEDWRNVDILLGGDGSVPTRMHLNDATQKQIPVYNKTISEEGYLNLCRALCHEIQIYKQLLTRAINLNETDVLESLQELNCPDDLTAEVRFCPQSYIDYSVD
mmetsp:Transcript_7202/g.15716  ORF Transcript_7202/g.15716 Transcript_7202/m.15716 type:complete len:564 (-) Transcript_7202:51-1742(-)